MITLQEIERAYDEHSREIFSYILRSVYNRDTAEDLLQDTFTRLIRYSEKKEVHSGNLKALIYTIARSVIIDNARSSAKRKTDNVDLSAIADVCSVADNNQDNYLLETIDGIIASMDEPEKSIILLRQNGLTYQEISSVTKIPERTLKRRVKSIIEIIRKKLRQEGFFVPADTNSDTESFND